MEVYGSKDISKRTAAISVNSTKIDNSELGFILDTEYGITTRTSIQFAPWPMKPLALIIPLVA